MQFMSVKRKRTLFPIGIALIALVSILAIIIFFANSPITQHPLATPFLTPVFANVELNASEGFTSSQLVEGPNIPRYSHCHQEAPVPYHLTSIQARKSRLTLH